MAATIVGLVLLYFGFGSIIYGTYINTNLGALFIQAIQGNGPHPGNTWLFVGVGLVVLGTAVLIIREVQRSKRKK